MKAEIQRKLKAAQVFCLDVDSTVVTVEGIDELAELAGVADAVKKLTTAAMEGGMTYHSALRQRLEIIKPDRSLIAKFLSLNPPTQQLSPNVRQLIKLLHDRGATVYLVSGGFKELIAPVADALDIPLDNVYANSLRWTIDGQFSSFNPQSWTAVAGGKKRALEHIRHLHAADATASSKVSGVSNEKHAGDMGVTLVMIGEGGHFTAALLLLYCQRPPASIDVSAFCYKYDW
jgi:phosphoserine phosphatase